MPEPTDDDDEQVVVSHEKYDPLDLAQEIRRVDGNHDKGAADLAESLMPFLDRWIRQAYMDGRNDEAQWAPQDRADEHEQCRAELREKLNELRDTTPRQALWSELLRLAWMPW